ncbi:MAG: diguanylate cyclase [Chloroflexi bacterium]|nr:diguanylate cyclase [Chloroflexota bacterium]
MPRRPFTSLRARMLLLVIAAIIPAIGINLYSVIRQRQLLLQQTQNTQLQFARLAANEQEERIAGARLLLATLAELPEVRAAGPGCSARLGRLLAQRSGYENIGVAALNGDVLCSARAPAAALNVSRQPFFVATLRSGGFSTGGFQTDPIVRKLVTTLGYPLLDDRHAMQGVVFAAANADWLARLMADAELPPDSTLTLFDSGKTIVARFPAADLSSDQPLPDAAIFDAVLARHEGVVQANDLRGQPRFCAFAQLDPSVQPDTFVTICSPRDVVFAGSDILLRRILLLLGLVSVAVLVSAWIGAGFVVQRIDVMLKAARKVAAGDLSVRTEIDSGPGEISQLAQAFDAMADALQKREAQQQRAEAGLRYVGTHDVMTGLHNRAYFEEEVSRLEHSRHYPVSVVIADLNKLKYTNDREGHAAGDKLLQRMGQVLLAAFRAEDVVARTGGDEFAALLPNTDVEAAQKAMERVRLTLAAHNATHAGPPLSCALGLATAETGADLAAAIARADATMYQEKFMQAHAQPQP